MPARKKVEIQKLADGLMQPLTAVEEEAYQVKNRSGQDPLNYPIKLTSKIAALVGVIESADARPTDQSVEVFNDLSAQLDAQLKKMQQALATELPRLTPRCGARKSKWSIPRPRRRRRRSRSSGAGDHSRRSSWLKRSLMPSRASTSPGWITSSAPGAMLVVTTPAGPVLRLIAISVIP